VVAKRCQVGKVHARVEQAAQGPPVRRRRATQSEQQLHILLALPGVGHVTARTVCARFRSLHDLLHADVAQLATVPGVGPLRAAAALEQLLHVALPTSHDVLTAKSGEDVQTQATYTIQEQELT
jgi:ERCC4-type nuclease